MAYKSPYTAGVHRAALGGRRRIGGGQTFRSFRTGPNAQQPTQNNMMAQMANAQAFGGPAPGTPTQMARAANAAVYGPPLPQAQPQPAPTTSPADPQTYGATGQVRQVAPYNQGPGIDEFYAATGVPGIQNPLNTMAGQREQANRTHLYRQWRGDQGFAQPPVAQPQPAVQPYTPAAMQRPQPQGPGIGRVLPPQLAGGAPSGYRDMFALARSRVPMNLAAMRADQARAQQNFARTQASQFGKAAQQQQFAAQQAQARDARIAQGQGIAQQARAQAAQTGMPYEVVANQLMQQAGMMRTPQQVQGQQQFIQGANAESAQAAQARQLAEQQSRDRYWQTRTPAAIASQEAQIEADRALWAQQQRQGVRPGPDELGYIGGFGYVPFGRAANQQANYWTNQYQGGRTR